MRGSETERSAPSSRKPGNGGAARQTQRGSKQKGADGSNEQAAPGMARRLKLQHPKAGNCYDRNEQHRTDAEEQQQRIAEIGARASDPIRGRSASSGAERGIGRIVCGQSSRGRQAQQNQHRAPGPKSQSVALRQPAPRASQVPNRASARARLRSPCPTPRRSSSVRNPPRGVPGQAKSWRHCDERVSGAAMDRSDVIIFGGGLIGLALASALDSSGLSTIVVDPADPTLRGSRGIRRANQRRLVELDAHADGDRRCRLSR